MRYILTFAAIMALLTSTARGASDPPPLECPDPPPLAAAAFPPGQCPAGVCRGRCNCVQPSKCAKGFCPETVPYPLPSPVVRPVATSRPAVAYDGDHRCDRCGAYQNVVHSTLPGGAHTHRCSNCGNVWQHGGAVPLRQVLTTGNPTVYSSPLISQIIRQSAGGCSSGNCAAPSVRRRW
jgi:predicted Zn finger-like uncharacterized protein